MISSRSILSLALTLVAFPVFATCPTGADLATGIVFEDQDGNVETFRAAANATVQMDGVGSDGYTYRSILGKGVHVVQLSDTENGSILPDSIINTSYPMNVASLPVPTASSQWSVKTVINAFGDIYEEVQTQRWGGEIDFVVGACSFRGIPGKVRYSSDGFQIDEEIMFLPDLGMSLLMSYDDSESDKDTFVYIEARTLQ